MLGRCIVSVCNKNPNLILMREVEMAQLAAGSWASASVLGYAQPVSDPILPRFNQSTWQALEGGGTTGMDARAHEEGERQGQVRAAPLAFPRGWTPCPPSVFERLTFLSVCCNYLGWFLWFADLRQVTQDVHKGPVVRRVDSAIHRINLYLYVWIAQLVSLILIHWIAIYPMDSAVQLLSNWGQVETGSW